MNLKQKNDYKIGSYVQGLISVNKLTYQQCSEHTGYSVDELKKMVAYYRGCVRKRFLDLTGDSVEMPDLTRKQHQIEDFLIPPDKIDETEQKDPYSIIEGLFGKNWWKDDDYE